MANFSSYVPTLKRWEGGFVNHPSDPGGATNAGVTLYTFRSFYGQSKTIDDLKNMTDAQWRFIMKTYWDKCKADDIENQSIAEIFVDWTINSGASAIRKVQTIFGIKVDGKVGRQTLGILNGPDKEVIFNRIKAGRISFYNKLAITKPEMKVFLKGWLSRANYFKFTP